MIATLYNRLAAEIERLSAPTLPTLARIVFAGVLLMYFWGSGTTKPGPGLFGVLSPSLGAYAQIFPRAMEAAGYDPGQLGLFHRLVVVAGTLAEFILPTLIILGLFTRLAAVGMIGFVVVQSATDIIGHGVPWGAWFDRLPDAVILDQRALWILLLLVLVAKGAGPLSADRMLGLR
ncbi:DoxX family membrane protein [Aliigemmobacter aestuarii]|uniref:DoxX family membrane protein n=1 Tax=Aliigemmobacter aestuarii TaxID=1445661 RepID=A0A4S3MQF3_9RHOB|nr:DoxX family membrane protein [Gemmobacter aestuarii]THD84627.1 DoxX family membrane protein [Gemmobacter aestuarii]